MLSLFWPKKRNNLRLQVQGSVLDEGLDQLLAVKEEIEVVKNKLGFVNGGHKLDTCGSHDAWKGCPFGGLQKNGEVKPK